MKNVAIWVIVGIVAANFVAARKSERRAEEARRQAARAEAEAQRLIEREAKVVRVVNGQVTTSVTRDGEDGTAVHIERRDSPSRPRRITVARNQVVIEDGEDSPSGSSSNAGRRPRSESSVAPAPPAPPKPPVPPAPPAPPAPPKPALASSSARQLADIPPPAWLPKSEAALQDLTKPDDKGIRVVVGKVSASPEKARDELRKVLEQEVAKWASPDVPTDWRGPKDVYEAIAGETYIQPITQELEPDSKSLENVYIVYRGIQKADFSDASRARVVETHEQERVTARLIQLGGGLGFILVCLGCLTGYVKADEATKGYYTNRLRLAAAIGAGVAGTVIYQMLA